METQKKLLALLLAICSVMSLFAPVGVSAEETTEGENYVFPEFSKSVLLGEPLSGEMSITEDIERITVDGKEYLLVAAKGGTLYVFQLTKFLEEYNPNAETDPLNWIRDQKSTGIDASRGIVGDSTGKFYIVGGTNYIYVYDFYQQNGYQLNLPTTRGDVADICIDKDDNLYIAFTPNTPQLPAQVLKVDTRNNNKISVVYETMELDHTKAIICGDDGYMYTVGTARGYVSCNEVHQFDPITGQKKGEYFLDKTSMVLYLSWIDGVLFVGNSTTVAEGFVALDTTTMQKIDMGVNYWIMGCVPYPKDGITYIMLSNYMLYKYDVAKRTLTLEPSVVGVGLNLRLRNPWFENINYQNITGSAIFTMASGGATPTMMSTEGDGVVQFPEMIEGAISPASVRSIGAGIPGVYKKKVYADGSVSKLESEVAVYVGGFLTPRVRAYCPDLDEEDRIINGFSNGHAQTDNMLIYKNKIYVGAYSGGYLVEYDPVTEEVRDLLPEGLYKNYYQVRLHGLAAGDDKIFFGTIPTTGVLGGVIGWVDLITGEVTVIDKPMGELSIIGLVYDEKTGLLYGAGSTKGNSNTTTTAEEAYILVYDVKNNKKLGQFSCLSSRNPYSDMVWDFEKGDVLPYYIGGISQDPQTGKIWGLVGRTLFSMYYDPAVGSLRMHQEWAPEAAAKSYYPASGAMHWFNRPFMFDGKGNLYLTLDTSGLYRFNLSDLSDNVLVSNEVGRIVGMGSDGNIYYSDGTEFLYMIAIGRVSIVKAMIDGTEPKDRDGVLEARKAYNALTAQEQTEVGEKYLKKLAGLEGAVDIFRQVDAERVDKAITGMGAVTATSSGTLMAVRNAYEALDEKGKSYVTKYQALVDAENAYAAICAKTPWGDVKTVKYGFGMEQNPDIPTGMKLANVKYGHTTKALWEFATGSGKLNGKDHIQTSFGSKATNYLGLKLKVLEAGLYDLTIDTPAYESGCIGAVYLFPTAGLSPEELYTQIGDEVVQCSTNAEHYVGSVDYTIDAVQKLGKWECPAPGEYILVFGLLRTVNSSYGRIRSVTMSKSDPVTDPMVELVKDRVNAIGKVTKKSGDVIKEAKMTFEALSAEQKELIYCEHIIKAAEEEYAYILANDTTDADNAAVALVQIQIAAIGKVTAGSGDAIKTAREAYNALEKRLQKKVNNYKDLTAAEAEYLLLTAEPVGKDTGSNMTTVIIIVVAVVVLAAAAVAAVLVIKKKKNTDSSVAGTPSE